MPKLAWIWGIAFFAVILLFVHYLANPNAWSQNNNFGLKKELRFTTDKVALQAAQVMAQKACKYTSEGKGCFLQFRADHVLENAESDCPRAVILTAMELISDKYPASYAFAMSQNNARERLVNNRDYNAGLRLVVLLGKFDQLKDQVNETPAGYINVSIRDSFETLKKESAKLFQDLRNEDEQQSSPPASLPKPKPASDPADVWSEDVIAQL